jgi:pyruvate dehydrogenase E2 component (dihydrolipoamide acetyltransferase)
MSSIEDVVLPDIGDFDEVPVIEILVQPGDVVAVEDPLLMLESDKAVMEVPAPLAGTVKEVLVSVGDTVSKGTRILTIEVIDVKEAASPDSTESQSEVDSLPESSSPVVEAEPAGSSGEEVAAAQGQSLPEDQAVFADVVTRSSGVPPHASPAVRKYARELGVDVHLVPGSGPKGRIRREDVQLYVKELSRKAADGGSGLALDIPPWPSVDFAQFGEVERVQLSRLRRISGPALSRNWVTIPHVTNFDEADVSTVDEFRRNFNREGTESGVKMTLLTFVIKACVRALKEFPEFNSSLDGKHLVLKRYFHIGFAADTPNGLMVPVIKNADQKNLSEIAMEISELAGRAREGRLAASEMEGGSFSVSSLGAVRGLGFTPIINAPEVAILGVARARKEPVWDGEQFQPRLVLPLSLSWDHRAVDGAAAGRFLAFVSTLLEDFSRMLL